MMNNKKIIAIYIRVSTQEQANEGYSIDEQAERLTKYADAQGWMVYRVYSDPGYSGASLDRPGLKEMIRDAEHGRFETVVVYKLDRLSRSQKDTLFLIEDVFLKHGVNFVSMTENFDTSSPFGRAMIGILSVFAQLEREQIKERMSMGIEARAKAGLFHGGGRVPIGYQFTDGQLIIDPYESEIVRRIFREFNTGRAAHAIARDLKSEGLTTKYGTLTVDTVNALLKRNKSVLGVVVHNGTEYPGQHEAIITQEEYEKAQRRFRAQAENTNGVNFRKYASIITGLCYCPHCEEKKVIRSRAYKQPDDSYIHRKVIVCNAKKAKKCPHPFYYVDIVENYILEQIRSLSLDPEYLSALRTKTDVGIDDEQIRIYEEKIKSNETKISRLMDLYTIGGIDLISVKEKVEVMTRENSALIQKIEQLKITSDSTFSNDDIISMSNSLGECMGDMEKARIIVKTLIKRITFEGNEITIQWAF